MNWIETLSEALNSFIRPVITMMFAGTVCYLAIKSGITISAEALLGQAGTIIAFWFAARESSKAITAIAAATKAQAETPIAVKPPCPDNNAQPQGVLSTDVQASPSNTSPVPSDTSTDAIRTPMG